MVNQQPLRSDTGRDQYRSVEYQSISRLDALRLTIPHRSLGGSIRHPARFVQLFHESFRDQPKRVFQGAMSLAETLEWLRFCRDEREKRIKRDNADLRRALWIMTRITAPKASYYRPETFRLIARK